MHFSCLMDLSALLLYSSFHPFGLLRQNPTKKFCCCLATEVFYTYVITNTRHALIAISWVFLVCFQFSLLSILINLFQSSRTKQDLILTPRVVGNTACTAPQTSSAATVSGWGHSLQHILHINAK